MSSFQLWGVRYSTCTQRALFTAAELGVPVDFHSVDLSTGAHKSAEYMKRQPFGKIPAAELNGFQFYESRAIGRALARSTPTGEAIYPSGDLKRVALFEQWASLEAGTLTAPLEKVVTERVFKQMYKEPADEALVRKAMEGGQLGFQVWDAQLASAQYVAGEFSLVDIFLAPYFNYFVGTPEGKQTLEQYSNIAAWWQRLSGRPAWQKIVAEMH